MTGNISSISNYQKVNQFYKNNQTEYVNNENGASAAKGANTAKGVANEKNASSANSKSGLAAGVDSSVKISTWKPVKTGSSLIPTTKDGYGTVIGDVELSDKAKEYYEQLKKKFNGMDFILVSSDMKQQVAANASAYGNSTNMVVLIDVDKIERMANDESFRKKYEGIIEMSRDKLLQARNTLASSGVSVKNFGMSVAEDGTTSFFATIEKANEIQAKNLEKRQAAKKEEKAKEKKQAQKEEQQERIENLREKKYLEFSSDNLDDLISSLEKYADEMAFSNAKTEEETMIGQNIDFKG